MHSGLYHALHPHSTACAETSRRACLINASRDTLLRRRYSQGQPHARHSLSPPHSQSNGINRLRCSGVRRSSVRPLGPLGCCMGRHRARRRSTSVDLSVFAVTPRSRGALGTLIPCHGRCDFALVAARDPREHRDRICHRMRAHGRGRISCNRNRLMTATDRARTCAPNGWRNTHRTCGGHGSALGATERAC